MRSLFGSSLTLAALAAVWGEGLPHRAPPPDPLEGVDIVREHGLIQKKASNLSVSQRRAVEYRYSRLRRRQEESPA